MVYSEEEVERDKKKVEEIKAKFGPEEIVARKRLELFEKLIDIMFYEFFRFDETCPSVRASEYDELVNKVSHILVDREANQVVCFYAKICDSEKEVEECIGEMIERNLKGGAYVKYGARSEGGKIILGAVENVPVFYLVIMKDALHDVAKVFTDEKMDPGKRREFMKGVFAGLLTQIESQLPLLTYVGLRSGSFLLQRVRTWLIDTGFEKVKEMLKKTSEGLREKGILLNEECELEMAMFKDETNFEGREKYTVEEIMADLEKVEDHLSKLTPQEFTEFSESRLLRKYLLYLINKFMRLKEDFYVVGAPLYDQVLNDVDILIVPKDTSASPLAVNIRWEKGESTSEERKRKGMEKNAQGGVHVKYAFKIIEEGTETKMVPSSLTNVPIIYTDMPKEEVYRAIKSLAFPGKPGS